MKTYYEILGVSKDCDNKEIRAVYRKLVKKFHPDVAEKNSDPKLFEEITAAYTTLTHPEKRKQYDQSLLSKKTGGAPLGASLVFKFREWKEWLFSLSFVRMLLTGKKISRTTQAADPAILELPEAELIQRIVYSRNIYVQINAVRAIFARGNSAATKDLLRLLYSGINESVKIEILNGLKEINEPRVQDVIRDVYDMEKSLKVKNLIRTYLQA